MGIINGKSRLRAGLEFGTARFDIRWSRAHPTQYYSSREIGVLAFFYAVLLDGIMCET